MTRQRAIKSWFTFHLDTRKAFWQRLIRWKFPLLSEVYFMYTTFRELPLLFYDTFSKGPGLTETVVTSNPKE